MVGAELLLIALLFQIAGLAIEAPPDMPLAPFLADHPRAVNPWWSMPNVLVMSAIQFRYPVPLLIPMKRENFSLHNAGLILPWYRPRPDLPVRAATALRHIGIRGI